MNFSYKVCSPEELEPYSDQLAALERQILIRTGVRTVDLVFHATAGRQVCAFVENGTLIDFNAFLWISVSISLKPRATLAFVRSGCYDDA